MDPVIGIQSVWIQSQITQSPVLIKHYLVIGILYTGGQTLGIQSQLTESLLIKKINLVGIYDSVTGLESAGILMVGLQA
jgi:hypothetical protein